MKTVLAIVAALLFVAAFAMARRPAPEVKRPMAPTQPPSATALPPPRTETPAPPAPPVEKPAPPPRDPIDAMFDRLLEAFRRGDREAVAKLVKELLALSKPADVPPEQNGAFAYLKAFEVMSALSEAETAAVAAMQAGTPTPDQVALLEALVARNREAIEAMKAAGAYEKCAYPVAYEKLFDAELAHISKVMQGMKLLESDAFLLARRGDDSAASKLAMQRLGDSLAGEPILISQLVRNVVLQHAGQGDPATLRPILKQVMMMELAAGIDWGMQQVAAGREASPEIVAMAEHYIESMREASALFPRPWHETREAWKALLARVTTGDWRADGSRMLLPAFDNVADRIATTEAMLGAPLDPFTGKAYLKRGSVTYSVGPNGIDDGGDPKLDVVVPAK